MLEQMNPPAPEAEADQIRPTADLAFDAGLAIFLRRPAHPGHVQVSCDGVSSLGHLVESVGVPLTEVGDLVVNGVSAEPSYRPCGGDAIVVAARSRPQLLDAPRFVLDVHLGTVARWMRLVGVDAAYSRDADDDALIQRANAERRVLLTQDRGLLQRRSLWLGAYVRGAVPADQFADVLSRFIPPLAPWSRCLACNGLLASVRKADIEPLLQPGTSRTYRDFSQCRRCGQVYWRGAHSRRLTAVVASADRIVRSASVPRPR